MNYFLGDYQLNCDFNPKIIDNSSKEEKRFFAEGSIIIDPWRKFPKVEGCKVIHYGNTRFRNQKKI